ncbi:MAG TPA: 16S rRNA (cytidine(1402)-2'-O)-methyltransferase [Geminicoccaceae bacterium]|nr:16S rRNA (cytidine(1402)-2'-O)-methyltransferase [Geminicoccaceae bacterium]
MPASKPAGGLFVVATPIGNLGDLTPRAAEVLAAVDLVVCEDSRVTGRLLHHLGISRPMQPYHEHNAAAVRPGLLARLRDGASLALVSDAGTPCISDPGYKLVSEAAAAGVEVRAVPGPSALVAAVSIAGLPTDRFLFQGFLPGKVHARRQIRAELAAVRATLVFYESAQRLGQMLRDCLEVLGDRPAAVVRELTKRFEEVRRGTVAELAAAFAGAPPNGEVVVLLGATAGAAPVADAEATDAALREALASLKPRAAALAVATRTGRSANQLYRRALELRAGARDPRECAEE